MMLSYYVTDTGIVCIENVDSLKEKYGRYAKYIGFTLRQAKEKHRKDNDLKNVRIEWINLSR